ncbi:MAG: hypothetical protein CMJ58_00100 [Planctomycetaceae bacterium]|nr:hypothetical protein [Planctomycetaceae bacterium]
MSSKRGTKSDRPRRPSTRRATAGSPSAVLRTSQCQANLSRTRTRSPLFEPATRPTADGLNPASFNSRFRQELLDRELFLGLEDARWCVDRCRLDYNHYRPHSSLGYVPPAEFAARWPASAPGPAEYHSTIPILS